MPYFFTVINIRIEHREIMETDSDNVQIEQLLLTIKECYVFKIPPLQTACNC